jgi:phenylpyruvate tautomerase PptA (4-oxalocrotonate tautomerase family)
MIKSFLYAQFVDLVLQGRRDDDAISWHWRMSICTEGISLDSLFREDVNIAGRVARRLREVAQEVASGIHVLVDDMPDEEVQPTVQNKRREHFKELVDMLDRWQVERAQ